MAKETELSNLVKANVKLIQIVSYESLRIHAMLVKTAEELGKNLFVWNRVEGIKKWNTKQLYKRIFVNPNSINYVRNSSNNRKRQYQKCFE